MAKEKSKIPKCNDCEDYYNQMLKMTKQYDDNMRVMRVAMKLISTDLYIEKIKEAKKLIKELGNDKADQYADDINEMNYKYLVPVKIKEERIQDKIAFNLKIAQRLIGN